MNAIIPTPNDSPLKLWRISFPRPLSGVNRRVNEEGRPRNVVHIRSLHISNMY